MQRLTLRLASSHQFWLTIVRHLPRPAPGPNAPMRWPHRPDRSSQPIFSLPSTNAGPIPGHPRLLPELFLGKPP